MLRNYFLINLILLVLVGISGARFYRTVAGPADLKIQEVKKEAQKDNKNAEEKKGQAAIAPVINDMAYNAIVQKDLFRQTRSAPATEEVPSVFFSNPPKLFGTMILNNEKSAIIEDPTTNTTKMYRLNDSMGGFTVSDIQENKVVLSKGDNTIEIKLREIKTIAMPRQNPQVRPYQPPPPMPPQPQYQPPQQVQPQQGQPQFQQQYQQPFQQPQPQQYQPPERPQRPMPRRPGRNYPGGGGIAVPPVYPSGDAVQQPPIMDEENMQ